MQTGFIYKPPIDIGISIEDNFRVWKIQLIFIDILIEKKGMAISIGIPLLIAYVWLFKFRKVSFRDIFEGPTFFLICLFLTANAKAGNYYYLFTNTSQSVRYTDTTDVLISKEKADEVTWLFDFESKTIQVITEMENLSLSLKRNWQLNVGALCIETYETDTGNICVVSDAKDKGEFRKIVWVLDDNKYIFEMK